VSHGQGKETGVLPRWSLVQAQFPPQPVCWPALEDDEQATRLEELDDWTRWLVNRYALDHRVVPACWAQHGAVLEEHRRCTPPGKPPTPKTPKATPRWNGTPTSRLPDNASPTGSLAPGAAPESTAAEHSVTPVERSGIRAT